MTPPSTSTAPSKRGFFVTLSIVGMLTLMVLFAALVGQYAQQYDSAFGAYASAQKMSRAERDISAALSSLCSVSLNGTYDSNFENITIAQGPM